MALSLAVLISFGASGCSGNITVDVGGSKQTGSASASSSPDATKSSAGEETEKVRKQAEYTLNELKALSESKEFTSFYNEMGTVAGDDPEAMAKIEAMLDKYKPLEDKIKEKIGLTPDALRGYQGIFAMSNASLETPYSEKFINSAITFSALGDVIGTPEDGSDYSSFGVTSNAVTENSGQYKLNTFGIYAKDRNDAVLKFPESASAKYGLENGGKKIVIEKVDGETRGELGSTSDYLASDLRNAAVQVETWIVSQNGEKVPLAVENGKIASGDLSNGDLEIKTSGGIELKFEGDSFNYIITGKTPQGTTQVYDSAKGGLQEIEQPLGAVSGDAGKYDYESFANVQKAYNSRSFKDLAEFVDYLNGSEYDSDAKFEATKKNGNEYVKVSDTETKIVENELLYVVPIK